MAHHAYIAIGGAEEVLQKVRSFAASEYNLIGSSNPDIRVFNFPMFSVEDARQIGDAAYQSSASGTKVILLYTSRIFHEAQNALLKVFEEPPVGVTLILGVPTAGLVLPTLRSRLIALPGMKESSTATAATSFLAYSQPEREKYIAKLIDRSKDKSEGTKQEARREASELISSLTTSMYEQYGREHNGKKKEILHELLRDLTAFAPLTHERSAPLKLIFEHLLLVIPTEP